MNTVMGLIKEAGPESAFGLLAELHSITETDKKLYVCAELVQGIELQKRVLTRQPLNEDQAKSILGDLASLLLAYHSKGLFYIDVRCEKIIITEEQGNKLRIKVVDNGNSLCGKERIPFEEYKLFYPKVASHDKDDSYLPPEIEAEGLNWASHSWALGVLGYFLLCGELPFTGPTDKKIMEGPSFEQKQWAGVSNESQDLIRTMLAVSPNDRLSLDKLSTLLKA